MYKPRQLIEPEDLFKLNFLRSVQLSPDGKMVAYTVSWVDTDEDKDQIGTWLLSLKTGESRRFFPEMGRSMNPQWSPDGKQIAFISSRGGPSQIFLVPACGGEAHPLTDLESGVRGGPVWSPDGKQIAYMASASNQVRDPSKPYRVTRFLYHLDGMGNVEDGIGDIFVTNIKGGKPKRLTNAPYQKSLVAWSPDGQELLFSASLFPDSPDPSPKMYLVNMAGETRELAGIWGWSISAAWSPDSKKIVYIGAPPDALDGTKDDLWVIDRRGGEPECRTSSLKEGVGGGFAGDVPGFGGDPLLIDEDGRTATVYAQKGGNVYNIRVALTGRESWELVNTNEPSSILLGGTADKLLYAATDFDRPADLFVSGWDGANKQQLTHLNRSFLDDHQMARVEHLLFDSIDGEQVEGWLLLPPMGTQPYPTILYSHPGPHNAYGHNFNFEFQMLAAAGFAVLVVNFRGSKGYGTEFGTRINGDWGNLDYQDSMAAVDHLVARGLADPGRLGCCGFSFGAYLTCWIVGHTNRFKAAVAENPLTDLTGAYGTSDNGPGPNVREMGGRPHEIPEVYRRCSPITYAHRCKTPTLLVLGEADHNCRTEQGEQFYTVLKASGCTVEMLRLPNMPHVGSKSGPPPIRRAQNAALLDWMKRYV